MISLKSFFCFIIYITFIMSQQCSSGSCPGLPNQFRMGVKLIPAEISFRSFCSYCILSSEERELYCIDPRVLGGNLMGLRPKTGISSFCKIVGTYGIEEVDFKIYQFLSKCMQRRVRQFEEGEKATSLTSDGNHLLSSFGLITLIPDGKCKMTAIAVDFPECYDCGGSDCYYRVQCGTCEQFTCGSWILRAGTCATCRSTMDC
jgi:hypothetical protein